MTDDEQRVFDRAKVDFARVLAHRGVPPAPSVERRFEEAELLSQVYTDAATVVIGESKALVAEARRARQHATEIRLLRARRPEL